MPERKVRDIRGDGTLRRKSSTSSGPADSFDSADTIDPTGILTEKKNNGTPKHQVWGDGRHLFPILTAPPAGAVPGNVWLEQLAGVTYLAYVDAAGTPQLLFPAGGLPPSPTIYALVSGVPTTIATSLVDAVGTIEWGVCFYKPAAAQRTHFRVVAGHDGTTGADATVAQLNEQATISFGALDVTRQIQLNGAGAGQTMDLVVTAGSVGWSVAIVAERLVAP